MSYKGPVAPEGLVVIGAGLPRTGTNSMMVALEQLLGGPCYHMKSVFMSRGRADADFWARAIRRNVKDDEWEKFLVEERKVRSTVDYPTSFYWKKLIELFPDTKVILTTRRPETWHKSVKESIYHISSNMERFPMSWAKHLVGMGSKMQVPKEVCSAIPEGYSTSVFGAAEEGEAAATQFFEQWHEDVVAVVPKDRLLIFEAKEGWEPLCEFLGVPVPENPYPRVNDTASQRRFVRGFKIFSYVVVFVLPVLLALGGRYVGARMGYV